jgi:hypothetical protein
MRIQRPVAGRTGTAVVAILACGALLSGACSMARQAKKRSGTTVVVQQIKGAEIKGELVGVRLDALVLDAKKGAVTIPISDIKSVWTVKKMSTEGRTAWGLGGLFGGIALGVGAAKASGIHPEEMGDSIAIGSAFLLGGLLIGEGTAVLIATKTHKGAVFNFTGKVPGEVELMLADLRKLARVPDYR